MQAPVKPEQNNNDNRIHDESKETHKGKSPQDIKNLTNRNLPLKAPPTVTYFLLKFFNCEKI